MALLQRTFTSGSLWIGTGSPSAEWNNYSSSIHNFPIAVYSGSNPLLYFNTDQTQNILCFNTKSAQGSE